MEVPYSLTIILSFIIKWTYNFVQVRGLPVGPTEVLLPQEVRHRLLVLKEKKKIVTCRRTGRDATLNKFIDVRYMIKCFSSHIPVIDYKIVLLNCLAVEFLSSKAFWVSSYRVYFQRKTVRHISICTQGRLVRLHFDFIRLAWGWICLIVSEILARKIHFAAVVSFLM